MQPMNRTTGNVFKEEFMGRGSSLTADGSSLGEGALSAAPTQVSRGKVSETYKAMDKLLASKTIEKGK